MIDFMILLKDHRVGKGVKNINHTSLKLRFRVKNVDYKQKNGKIDIKIHPTKDNSLTPSPTSPNMEYKARC